MKFKVDCVCMNREERQLGPFFLPWSCSSSLSSSCASGRRDNIYGNLRPKKKKKEKKKKKKNETVLSRTGIARLFFSRRERRKTVPRPEGECLELFSLSPSFLSSCR